MMRRVRWVGLLLLAGCLPISDLSTDLALPVVPYHLDPKRVETSYTTLPGFEVPGTPARLNRSFYLRYHPQGATDTILILIPGVFLGATNFDILARQLVASRPGLEVWAVDRRANALEDHTALRASLAAEDPDIAYRYYVEDAGTPSGFNAIPQDALGFMRRWGLVAHLHDLHAVVTRANELADTVILGGHSLGASVASFYAAFRFKEGLGDAQLDGLLLLDGTAGRTGAYGMTKGLLVGGIELLPPGTGYDEGRGYPYAPLLAGPGASASFAPRALLARFKPGALAPDTAFPTTNLAYFGVQADEDYASSVIFSASLGEAVGARYGGNLVAVILGGWDSRTNRTVVGVADGFSRVSWWQGGLALEHTDISTYAGIRVAPETDFSEWYFPLRLLVDVMELPLDLRERGDFAPHSEIGVPTLAVGAERGLVTSLDGFSAYSNLRASALFSSYVIPGYTHRDLVAARDNPVVPLFIRWLGQVTQLRGVLSDELKPVPCARSVLN